jgi:hypothetical protein
MRSTRPKPPSFWVAIAIIPVAAAGDVVGVTVGTTTAGRFALIAIVAIVLVMAAVAFWLKWWRGR